MKIINLQSENIKRLKAVDITPTENLVQITGKNGHGKTSVLDSIWWALEGAKNIQIVPINKDATTARIKLDLGELAVTRTFKKADNEKGFTTKLEVTNADGVKVTGGGQAMLDKLLDAITFDPLEFERMKPKDQFDLLRKFVPDVDFEAIDIAEKDDYESRKEINRDLKNEKVAANGVVFDAENSHEYVEISDLANELTEAGKRNSDIELRRNNRKAFVIKIKKNYEDAKKLVAEAEGWSKMIEDAGPLAELIDVSELNKKIDNASESNKAYDAFELNQKHAINALKLEKESDALTKQMQDRQIKKRKAISEAKFPVKNVSLEDGIVLLDGVPFEQGSSAEKTRASLAIAMANNPKLRIIFIRDGSLLDDESEKIVREMAVKNDFQIWQEKVDSSGKVGFVIENGELKKLGEEF